jgi:tetratricopeptide (TPR) repeat protein
MPKVRPNLYHTRESTRHFLYSKAEADDLEKEKIQTTSNFRKALQSVFSELLAGDSLLDYAFEQLVSVTPFGCMAIRIDGNPKKGNSFAESNPNDGYVQSLKILDKFCKEQNGIWGVINGDIFGCFFPGKDGSQCLELARSFQKTLNDNIDSTASVGIASYPTLNYKKAEMLDNASKALEHAAFFGPNSSVIFDAVSLNISGDKLFDQGDINGSIEEFRQALQLDPSNVNIHNSLGVCYGILGDYEKAKQEFKTTIKLDSSEVMAWYNLGFINMLKGNRHKALDLLLKANTINEDIFEVVFQTGRLLLEMGQPKSGKKFLEHASRLEPKSGAVNRYLGECYAASGQTPLAITAYKKAIKQNPGDAASLSALGCLFDQEGENPEISLMFCQESVQLSPKNGLFRYRLGQIYFNQNRLDEALDEFKKAELLGQNASEFITKIQTELRDKTFQ